MTSANINLIEKLMDMMTHMDHHHLQRLNDFAQGLLNSPVKDEDWWGKLDEETKAGILEADMDIDRGNFVNRDQLFGKYKYLL